MFVEMFKPTCLSCSDGKRLDGMSIIPWTSGRILTWDASCCDTFAASDITQCRTELGAVATQTESNKVSKYDHLDSSYLFNPLVFKSSGTFGPKAKEFLKDLGHRVRKVTLEDNAYQFLVQRITLAVQHSVSTSVIGSLGDQSCGLGDFNSIL